MNTFTKIALASAIALAAAGFTTSSQAGTATSSMPVTATVANNCSIDATGGLAFGSYDPAVANASAALDATGTVSVTCTKGASVAITLGQGANAEAGSTDAAPLRRMSDGATNLLSYSLYQDSGRTTAWGNEGTTDKATTGTGEAESHTVYGRVAANQDVPAGSYSDTVVATVTF